VKLETRIAKREARNEKLKRTIKPVCRGGQGESEMGDGSGSAAARGRVRDALFIAQGMARLRQMQQQTAQIVARNVQEIH